MFDNACVTGSVSSTSIVEHPDWKFGERLAVGESAIIYVGELGVHMLPCGCLI